MAVDRIRGWGGAANVGVEKQSCSNALLALAGSVNEVPHSFFIADVDRRTLREAPQCHASERRTIFSDRRGWTFSCISRSHPTADSFGNFLNFGAPSSDPSSIDLVERISDNPINMVLALAKVIHANQRSNTNA
jgi:hypothetical protein